jgi:8-oxo-dGTP pyrophosphatase MutT (NUDIX family)
LSEEICAGGFVVRAGRVLALRRKNGVWLAPKGHVDPGETHEQAAVREVREETGLQAEILAPLGETAYVHHEDGRPHAKRVHWYLMAAANGEIALEAEMFTAYKWLPPEEIDTFSFGHDRELARQALAFKALGEGMA